MNKMTYTTVDRILAKLSRELRGIPHNESDIIEWIGESLEFLAVEAVQEQALAVMEVNNHEADLPEGFLLVVQIARDNNWTKEDSCSCPKKIIEELEEEEIIKEPENLVVTDCKGRLIGDYEYAYYRPRFDLKWEFDPFYKTRLYKEKYTPVRLSDNTLYDSFVCREKDRTIYNGSEDEYTIVGAIDKKLRFSFKEGLVVMSYLRTVLDKETGYPLVPDNISYISAITYYIKWKLAERYQWNGREGYDKLSAYYERLWGKYCKQAKSYAKMPKTIDEYQNLLEQSFSLVPNHKRYYKFFGKIRYPQN